VNRREFITAAAAAAALTLPASGAKAQKNSPAFVTRGYYLSFMRMPTFGLKVWKEILDDVADDGANTIVLWLAGAFRSRRFPVTWQWAREHENVRSDFTRALIRHGHKRGIQVLLGFTPFGYDGTNQYPIEHPELKATGQNGQPVREFGIGCWGWNLCPAKPASQAFMRDYIREMAFEFYPEADGLLIESSDYAICHCADCGSSYFEHEFAFVRGISDEIWQRNRGATVVVYPHYFSGARLRFSFSEAVASKRPFDPRWTLFFTPHSAAIEPQLLAQARGAWWSNDGPARFNLPGMRAGAVKARDTRCTGWVPSLECFSYIPTKTEFGESWVVGRRQVPFGFGWLKTGANPYRTLPLRAIRMAYRELSANPGLPDADLHQRFGRELFGPAWRREQVDDLLFLFQVFNTDRDWSVPGALTAPGLVRHRAEHGRLDAPKRALLREQIAKVRSIAARHQNASTASAKELHDIARWLVDQWTPDNEALLTPDHG
jgi:hypothetical protein